MKEYFKIPIDFVGPCLKSINSDHIEQQGYRLHLHQPPQTYLSSKQALSLWVGETKTTCFSGDTFQIIPESMFDMGIVGVSSTSIDISLSSNEFGFCNQPFGGGGD